MSNIAFLFPGQGSQKVGMGQDLYQAQPSVREIFALADSVLGRDLASLCFDGPADELTRTLNAQPALLTLGVACGRLLQDRGVSPAMVAGHSLGEYAALVTAGVFDPATAMRVVKRRAELMDAAPPGAMAAVLGLDRTVVETLCTEASAHGVLVPANFNSPGQVVVSGSEAAIEFAVKRTAELGGKRALRLPVSGAFHSPLMEAPAAELAALLEATPFADPAVPVYPNATAQRTTAAAALREALARQMTASVLWEDTILRMHDDGAEIFVEVGPGKVLAGLVKRIVPEAVVLNVQDMPSLEITLAELA